MVNLGEGILYVQCKRSNNRTMTRKAITIWGNIRVQPRSKVLATPRPI